MVAVGEASEHGLQRLEARKSLRVRGDLLGFRLSHGGGICGRCLSSGLGAANSALLCGHYIVRVRDGDASRNVVCRGAGVGFECLSLRACSRCQRKLKNKRRDLDGF